MSLHEEIEALREALGRMAEEHEVDLEERYALRPLPAPEASCYRRARRAIGIVLRRWGLRRQQTPEPWLALLQHVEAREATTVLMVWGIGSDRDALRVACGSFQRQLRELRQFAPVLVTDVADFGFFSRLGWLVEYVPSLRSPPANVYSARKLRYLALRYRDALVLPASVGLAENLRIEDLLSG